MCAAPTLFHMPLMSGCPSASVLGVQASSAVAGCAATGIAMHSAAITKRPNPESIA